MIADQVRAAVFGLLDTAVDGLTSTAVGSPQTLYDVTPPPGVDGQPGPIVWLGQTRESYDPDDIGSASERVTVTQDIHVDVTRDAGDATDVYAECAEVVRQIRSAVRDVVTAGGQYPLVNDAGPADVGAVRMIVETTELNPPDHLPEYGTNCTARLLLTVRGTVR